MKNDAYNVEERNVIDALQKLVPDIQCEAESSSLDLQEMKWKSGYFVLLFLLGKKENLTEFYKIVNQIMYQYIDKQSKVVLGEFADSPKKIYEELEVDAAKNLAKRLERSLGDEKCAKSTFSAVLLYAWNRGCMSLLAKEVNEDVRKGVSKVLWGLKDEMEGAVNEFVKCCNSCSKSPLQLEVNLV